MYINIYSMQTYIYIMSSFHVRPEHDMIFNTGIRSIMRIRGIFPQKLPPGKQGKKQNSRLILDLPPTQ